MQNPEQIHLYQDIIAAIAYNEIIANKNFFNKKFISQRKWNVDETIHFAGDWFYLSARVN